VESSMGSLSKNLKAGEVVAIYQTLNLHDSHLSDSLLRLGVVDPLDLGYQSSGSFLYALSETDSSREVAGYGSKHCHCKKTGLPSVSTVIDARQAAPFGHFERFDDSVLTCCTLSLAMDVRSGTHPSPSWKLRSDRSRDTWLKTFLLSHIPIKERWDAAIRHGHGSSVQRSLLDTRH